MSWIKKITVLLFTFGTNCSHTSAFLNRNAYFRPGQHPKVVNNLTYITNPDYDYDNLGRYSRKDITVKPIKKRTYPIKKRTYPIMMITRQITDYPTGVFTLLAYIIIVLYFCQPPPPPPPSLMPILIHRDPHVLGDKLQFKSVFIAAATFALLTRLVIT